MNFFARIVSAPVVAYRYLVSPLTPPSCRFAPTCSEYALAAIAGHGAMRGLWLALRRVMRCHPWGGHGFDPVPPVAADHRQAGVLSGRLGHEDG